ncbi:hypothetical protein [Actinoplanes sp. GCM10030250]|uniref:hypothetical protein n=1 Tax=Actinoplanes sp. GCM10030250 TaxID=3273376 RepID=UPI00361225B0
MNVSVAAGATATVLFAVSTLPMLVKARRTRDVSSYSLGNIALGNVGNAFYTVYVLHLPFGPIWALHAFHTVSTFLMLYWYVRYARARRPPSRPDTADEPPDAALRRRVVLTSGRTANVDALDERRVVRRAVPAVGASGWTVKQNRCVARPTGRRADDHRPRVTVIMYGNDSMYGGLQ